ncbi:MAG: MFS transporter [Alphaproteobacteria bacterium]
MRGLHVPAWLGAVGRPGATSLALLFALAAFHRALLIAVLPLLALRSLGDAQMVSLFYFGSSIMGLAGSLAVPWIVRRITRRGTLTAATGAGLAALVLIGFGGTPGLLIGMPIYVFAQSASEICLSLYIMDHVGRREIGRFEPKRIFFAAGVWLTGPWLGVRLAEEAAWAPFALGIVGMLSMLGFFWFLRLTEHPAVSAGRQQARNPLAYFPRFFAQPRLRLAWLLAFGRACWWSTFFVYGPIYVVALGYDAATAGALVSVGMTALLAARLWGRVAARWGLRRLLVGAYTVTGLVTIGVAAAAGLPWLGAVMLVGSAMAAGAIDGAGNTPFLRAVHPLERPEMTTVFVTYRDAASLVPPGIYALLLAVAPLPAVFLVAGGGLVFLARFALFLPRRM